MALASAETMRTLRSRRLSLEIEALLILKTRISRGSKSRHYFIENRFYG